ncbi:F0F1 ATP synthase subunit delta [Crenothrix polyspora]|uniref:ATP synthase subunit delta n=1 Tax=Crenothrix polyspora TaxID=360316 RepID=A0A1R4H321_9GAMM|nr:F0F1 ATP synthase subunit delta [Crenothrix polyspora]SJM90249.1 ATP synthase subunit delta [Crenothrix polyspora]
MSELATMARPYAAAAFKRAKETQSTDKWSQGLAFMSALLSDKNMLTLVGNPKISKDKVCGFLLELCEGKLDAESINFLKLLVQNNRLILLPSIANLFEAYKSEDEGSVNVEVFTAFAFTKEAEKTFATQLEKTLSKKVRMNVTVDKSLIGGVLVRAGDRVIDQSVRGQLQHMQKALH